MFLLRVALVWCRFPSPSFFLWANSGRARWAPNTLFLVSDICQLFAGRRTLEARRLSEFSSFALMEMFVFNSREIVQSVLAQTAALMKSLCFTRGASTRTSSWMPVMVQPADSCSIVTVAVVCMQSGVNPSPASSLASAIEKHAACAAAISSLGLVLLPCASLFAKYCIPERVPLSVVTMPLPPLRLPTQTAEAFCFMKAVWNMKTDLERCEINGWLRGPSPARHTHTSIHRFELLPLAYSSCRAVVLPLPFRQYLLSGIWIAFNYRDSFPK